MQLHAFFVLFLLCVASPISPQRIKRVVSLMLENRSFDHYLGHLKSVNPNIDGVTTADSNPIDPANPSKGVYHVNFNATDVMDFDPHHDLDHVTTQVFGSQKPVSPAPMDGFVAASPEPKSEIMRCLNASMAPVITKLALEYALFDRWYASLPGPTMPNRMFYMSGTSDAATSNDKVKLLEGYPQRTIFDDIYESDKTFNVYYGDFPSALGLSRVREYPLHVKEYRDFLTDAANGDLPHYSFVEPRYFTLLGAKENDQHPPTSISQGEFLVKSVYEALVNSPQWNETLLIITYDEHGGLYDHVPTPLSVPNPDGKIAEDGFNFERLGIRVPTIAISPWIKKGTLLHEPKKNHYDHTSMLGTLRKVLDLKQPALTKREAWAATFEDMLTSLDEPRSDCIKTLPVVPGMEEDYKLFFQTENTPGVSSSLEPLVDGEMDKSDISGLQWEVLDIAWGLTGGTADTDNLRTAHDGALYVRRQLQSWLNDKQSAVDAEE